MQETSKSSGMTRREMVQMVGKAAVVTLIAPPLLGDALAAEEAGAGGGAAGLAAAAGPDRVVVLPGRSAGRTYVNAWAGYGDAPRRVYPNRWGFRDGEEEEPEETGPAPSVKWSEESGPGEVSFEDAGALVTTASFAVPGEYVLRLAADNGEERAESRFTVKVEAGPAGEPLAPVTTKEYRIESRLWNQKAKALITSWIPWCIDQIERTDLERGAGGLDNFDEAAKALRGESHGEHKGYVFSNAWVHQTVESMAIALMVDAQGDEDILAAQARFRDTLEEWIPRILAAQHSDGYLQTAFTLRDPERWAERWTEEGRGNHEGYVAGYFIESAINHHVMTGGEDTRLYDAAKKLADCWDAHIGPPPKQAWYDGHQEMEQALVRFGRYVNEVEGRGAGDRYVALAKFLLDCRGGGTEYDQSHLPVVQQYEAVGHAVRAVYNYSAMADVALETRDPDYLSATRSLWDNIVNKKYYVTGGVGSGETSEGFGPDYSLRNNAYCESCSSCGQIFFQSKLNHLYGDASYADLYEETLYNALLGSMDLEGTEYYYTNPLDANRPRHAWHNCPCCVGNIPRTLLMLPTWMYAKGRDSLYVNLFVGSTATVEGIAGTDVEVVQATEYPHDGRVAITLNPAESRTFALRVRVPNRDVSGLYRSATDADGLVSLAVNGSPMTPRIENGYAVIERRWEAGDSVELELPMRVQRVYADERIEADRGKVALRYGPLVYAIEAEDQDITKALPASAAVEPEWREDLLGGLTVLRSEFADGSPVMAIPYYARYNRASKDQAPPEQPSEPGQRPPPPPPTAVVWIEEA